MAVSIYLYTVDKKRFSLKKIEPSSAAIPCFFRKDTSLIRPTFEIRSEKNGAPSITDMSAINYAYCPELKRYYFVLDIIYVTAVITQIQCEVDVLATYQLDILNTNAFVMYSQRVFDSRITDTRFPLTNAFYDAAVDVDYPVEITGTTIGTYMLTVAGKNGNGKTGICSTYALSAQALTNLANVLYTDSMLEKLVNELNQPLQGLIRCIWIPYLQTNVSDGNEEIVIGSQPMGVRGNIAKEYLEATFDLAPVIPHKTRYYDPISQTYKYDYGDYRNLAPYARYFVTLPGCGEIELPMDECIASFEDKDPIFKVTVCISPIDGNVTYIIAKRESVIGSSRFGDISKIVTGNVGIELPMSAQQTNITGMIKSALTTVGSAMTMGVGVASASPLLFASGLYGIASNFAGGVMAENQKITSHSGNLGGFSNRELNIKPFLYTRVYNISDEPSNAAPVIGRPYFRQSKLSSLTGLIICSGAKVSAQGATATELDMINNIINGSEGFIIE